MDTRSRGGASDVFEFEGDIEGEGRMKELEGEHEGE